MKVLLVSVLVIAVTALAPAGAQQYTCSAAFAQTYNTLDSGNISSQIQNNYEFVYPPSGSIAVTTGVLTITALDKVYTNAYFYYPAGAWTSSTAGWYYTTCSSTTSCLVYSNQYTSGIPTTPLAPALVTTGAGAYTQVTGSYINGRSIPFPGNVLGNNGQFVVTLKTTFDNSAGQKYIGLSYGSGSIGGVVQTTNTAFTRYFTITNQGSTGVQTVIAEGGGVGISGFFTTDSTTAQYITERMYLGTATDYNVSHSMNVQVTK